MSSDRTPQTLVRNNNFVVPSRIEIRPSAGAAATAAAHWIASHIRLLATQKAPETPIRLAFSGGRTPLAMFGELSRTELPWAQIWLYQVDERCVPADDARRNAAQLVETFGPVLAAHNLADHLKLMPVEEFSTGSPAADPAETTRTLVSRASKYVPDGGFDIVHLGLGDDGHTASLVPGDPALSVPDAAVALTRQYQGTVRLTLTYRTLRAASNIVWLVTGESKAPVVPRLLSGDPTIPAGRLADQPGVVFLDKAAAVQVRAMRCSP